MSLVQSVDGCQETWGGCHGREICIMLLHAGHRGLIEPLDHCAMHARRPADLRSVGLFKLYLQWKRTCLVGATADL